MILALFLLLFQAADTVRISTTILDQAIQQNQQMIEQKTKELEQLKGETTALYKLRYYTPLTPPADTTAKKKPVKK